MATQQIECTVSSCYYWHDGDECRAAKILVRMNEATNVANAGYEFGDLSGAAQRSPHTMCETFIVQQQGPKPGIHRIDR